MKQAEKENSPLRQKYIAAALQGLCANPEVITGYACFVDMTHEQLGRFIAKRACEIADAALEEQNK